MRRSNDSVDHVRRTEQWKAEYEELRQEAERERKELNKKMGELSHKLGTMVEDCVVPDLPRHLRLILGLPEDDPVVTNFYVRRLHPNPQQNGQRQTVEIDAIVESHTQVMFNETKSTLRSEHVTKFAELMSDIRTYFPEYQSKTMLAATAMSSFRVTPEIVTYASRQGIIVRAIDEGLMTRQNGPNFQWMPF